MNDGEIRSAIHGYVEHICQATYIDDLVRSVGHERTLATLEEMLLEPGWDWLFGSHAAAALFAGDACHYGDDRMLFRRAVVKSRLMGTIRALGLSGHFHLRGLAVELLDDVGGRESSVILGEIFEHWFPADPFLLCRICTTVPIWGSHRRRWGLVVRLANSSSATARWATLSTNGNILGLRESARDKERAIPLLKRLAMDSFPLIAVDARHRLEEWATGATGAGGPWASFDMLRILLGNMLCEEHRLDFTEGDVERITRQLEAEAEGRPSGAPDSSR